MGAWDDFMINPVTFQTVVPTIDTSGDSPNGIPSAGSPLMASVQGAKPGRVVQHGGEQSVVSHSLYFTIEPLDDSTGARPDGRCRLKDLFLWAFDPADPTRTKTFFALGEAVDMAGRGEAWRVDCVLVE